MILLLIARFELGTIMIIIVTFISQIFFYMLRLIKDVDQPIEYDPTGKVRTADIDLFPLLEYDQRAKKRI